VQESLLRVEYDVLSLAGCQITPVLPLIHPGACREQMNFRVHLHDLAELFSGVYPVLPYFISGDNLRLPSLWWVKCSTVGSRGPFVLPISV